MKITNIVLILCVAVFGSAAAFGLFTAGCLYDNDLLLCRHENGGLIVVIIVLAANSLWLASLFRERLRRRLMRGMYTRVRGSRRGAAMVQVMQSAVKLAIDGQIDSDPDNQRHPLDWPDNYGWRVPLDDGTAVWVYVDELYRIVSDAWEFQHNPANRNRAALGQRRLDPVIGRPKTLAVNYLVDLAGGLRCNKDSANSTRRIALTPWSIMQNLIDIRPPGEL